MESKQLMETVTKARRGDSAALQELYLDMYKSVFYLALRIVKNPEDAEDITQEVYITVQQKIAELREPAAFYGWVNQITVNQCNALLRKYKGIARLDDEDEIINLIDDDPANLPDKALDDEATRKIILEVIDNLPDGQRACVILYYYTQNTIAQIADMLETNENTVKSRLALARAKIRAALEYKAEKEGIKLWGIPLALTPILREAFEQFVMPEGAEARIVDFISKATAENANTGDSSGADTSGNSGTSGRIGPKSGTGGAAKTGMSMATKIIIGVVAAAIVTVGVIFLPPLFNSPDKTTTPGVTDTAWPEPNNTEQADAFDTEQSEAPQGESNIDGDYSNFSSAAAELIGKLVKAVSDDDRREASLLLLEIHELNDESIPVLDRSNPNNITTTLLESASIFTEEVNGQRRTHFGGMRGQIYVDIMTDPDQISWNIRNYNENGELYGKVLTQGYGFSGNLIFED